MAMRAGTEEGTAMADINVTPLVDVMLVLLIRNKKKEKTK